MNTSQDSPSLGFTQRITLLIACLVFSAFLLFFKGAIDQENSLDYLARISLEPTVALGNGKPTVFEFYADWCGHCQDLNPKWNVMTSHLKNAPGSGLIASVPEDMISRVTRLELIESNVKTLWKNH